MMNSSVEMLKEKLRPTRSEPNNSASTIPTSTEGNMTNNADIPDSEYHPRFVTKAKSSSYSGPRERRARWINDKVRRNNITSLTSSTSSNGGSNYANYGTRESDSSGFQDEDHRIINSLPKYHSSDETQRQRRNQQGQGQNNNEPLNYK